MKMHSIKKLVLILSFATISVQLYAAPPTAQQLVNANKNAADGLQTSVNGIEQTLHANDLCIYFWTGLNETAVQEGFSNSKQYIEAKKIPNFPAMKIVKTDSKVALVFAKPFSRLSADYKEFVNFLASQIAHEAAQGKAMDLRLVQILANFLQYAAPAQCLE